MQNHFELFQLPQRFALDQAQLDAAYREVQNTVHPDKFVQASEAEKRVAMQWATQANEAYQVLKKPLKRARYLCELQGVDLQTESNTSMPGAFLMQQMEWRETFEDAVRDNNQAALLRLEREVNSALRTQLHAVGEALDLRQFQEAAQQLRACMFLEKFIADIVAIEE
ncbi:Fe-S protein assembly co-chaperone HscB [Undibacterium sp. TJN19]|uniref:Fe-S protein assembly co-chaperone HscB n=1 Tax=Undibacterium sp. TJN19 TaxID=3413055 RepID=UPI003BF3B111